MGPTAEANALLVGEGMPGETTGAGKLGNALPAPPGPPLYVEPLLPAPPAPPPPPPP